MTCLFLIFSMIAPRVIIFLLALFTNWFTGVFSGIFLPVLGFFFLPATTLWYSVVYNYYQGEWSFGTVLGMIFCVMVDTSGSVSVSKREKKD